ncbi:hypothetical protein ACE6H2_017129 [Prunus campanulata]
MFHGTVRLSSSDIGSSFVPAAVSPMDFLLFGRAFRNHPMDLLSIYVIQGLPPNMD